METFSEFQITLNSYELFLIRLNWFLRTCNGALKGFFNPFTLAGWMGCILNGILNYHFKAQSLMIATSKQLNCKKDIFQVTVDAVFLTGGIINHAYLV